VTLSGQINDYEIVICYFSASHQALRRKSKVKTGWFGIRIMCPSWATGSIRGLLFGELAL